MLEWRLAVRVRRRRACWRAPIANQDKQIKKWIRKTMIEMRWRIIWSRRSCGMCIRGKIIFIRSSTTKSIDPCCTSFWHTLTSSHSMLRWKYWVRIGPMVRIISKELRQLCLGLRSRMRGHHIFNKICVSFIVMTLTKYRTSNTSKAHDFYWFIN